MENWDSISRYMEVRDCAGQGLDNLSAHRTWHTVGVGYRTGVLSCAIIDYTPQRQLKMTMPGSIALLLWLR